MKTQYDIVIVGGGMAGLTASAYCTRSGYSVLLCEQQPRLGGLIGSFEREGFVFDQGIRAIENSGIIFPMLKQLGISLSWVKSPVTLAVGDQKIKVDSLDSFADYQEMLGSLFPENKADIQAIMEEIQKITSYMDVLYGIDNPLFLDSYQDLTYLRKTLLPWFFRYLRTIKTIEHLQEPVGSYLKRFTSNQALIDLIAQHFFQDTPTFFALSYFGLYLAYQYPLGGTGALPTCLAHYAIEHGLDTAIRHRVENIDVEKRCIDGQITYKHLIWAADLKSLYRIAHSNDKRQASAIENQRKRMEHHRGGDSIFSLYVATDLEPSYFSSRSSAHLFYTPNTRGQSSIDRRALDPACHDKDMIEAYLKDYFHTTTYEISLPVLRDPTLAPKGCTGLVVSTLFPYELAHRIQEDAWYEECKRICEQTMLAVLSDQLYPDLFQHCRFVFSSTPTTLERLTSNSEGAITGWSFTDGEVPVVHQMRRITKSVETVIAHVSQAGQWSFSPSGLPISAMTGNLAAKRAIKDLKKR
ncbi:MAG: phytoene desaturase family protein [Sphaerochaeta sp.]|jgi:phytoene dehydrogenase-like protein|uniref:phytoene desaturase family protein n=1 Tax=Sphaerochaeta sp. TaxID=1972642 RepID=UPI003D0F1E72